MVAARLRLQVVAASLDIGQERGEGRPTTCAPPSGRLLSRTATTPSRLAAISTQPPLSWLRLALRQSARDRSVITSLHPIDKMFQVARGIGRLQRRLHGPVECFGVGSYVCCAHLLLDRGVCLGVDHARLAIRQVEDVHGGEHALRRAVDEALYP